MCVPADHECNTTPLAHLDHVEALAALVQQAELALVHGCRVRERLVIGRVLERGQKRLVVADLREELSPLADKRRLPAATSRALQRCSGTSTTAGGKRRRDVIKQLEVGGV